MRSFPILLQPIALALKNRWLRRSAQTVDVVRDVIILGFGFIIMVAIYRGTLWSLSELRANIQLSSLPAVLPLSLVLMLLFMMILISNIVGALSSLYLAEDLELILAAPMSRTRFFISKYLYCALFSSWMPLVFLIPLLLAFGHFYNVAAEFYVLGPVILILMVAIPTGLAMAIATLMSIVVPANRTRWIRFALIGMFLIVVSVLFQALQHVLNSGEKSGEIIRTAMMLASPSRPWLPSHWAANCFQELLQPSGFGALPELLLLVFGATGTASAAFLLTDTLHGKAYSRTRDTRTEKRGSQDLKLSWTAPLKLTVRPGLRSLVDKEFRSLGRDVTSLIEISMLFGVSIIYVYNLRSFTVIADLSPDEQIRWKGILFLINALMNAFITNAIATRFAFPSISREGKGIWILTTAPLTPRELMETKFKCWYPLICMASLLFFFLGCFALNVSSSLMIVSGFIVLVLSYGLVRSAIGFGAYFSFFDWDHPSQLIAGFGSLMYMVFSVCLIALTMIPSSLVLFFPPTVLAGYVLSDYAILIHHAVVLLVVLTLNVTACRWVFDKGVKALEAERR